MVATSTRFAAANLLKAGGGGRVLWLSSSALFHSVSDSHSFPSSSSNNRLGGIAALSFHNRPNKVGTLSISSATVRERSVFRRSSAFCTAAANDATASDEQDQLTKLKNAADLLDIRVGRILRAWRHEEADSLYVEEVDIGEPEPRIICSGLVNYIPLHQLEDIKVVVLANLKPRNMRGVKSFGMLMAASDPSHENVELLVPPEGSIPGDRIWFGSQHDRENQPSAATPNQIQKKKIWELVQPHLKTDDSCIAMFGDHVMRTSAGVVLCRSLKNAIVS